MPSVGALLNDALAALGAGDGARAERLCRQALAKSPQEAEAFHLLALRRLLVREYAAGERLLHAAIALAPGNGGPLMNLGRALNEQSRWAEALPVLRRALAVLGGHPEALNSLGNARLRLGDADGAVAAYAEALRLQPGRDDIRRNLAVALRTAGRTDEAAAELGAILQRTPGDVDSALDLAAARAAQHRLGEAEAILRTVLDARPDDLRAAFALGVTLSDMGRWSEAEEVFHTITRLDPHHADAHQSRGVMLKYLGRLTEGLLCQQRALELRQDFPRAWLSLGAVLTDCGRLEDAVDAYRRSLDLAPDPSVHSNLCYTLCLVPAVPRAVLEIKHRAYGSLYGDAPREPHANAPDPDRRLRIGYVSADLREHSVAYFFEPVLASHDRAAFEVTCYAGGTMADAVTGRLMGLADRWRDIRGLGPDAVARQVRADGIDILVDLGGHTMMNHLAVFARKPAPVQVTWLGYPETTGMAAIDHKVTDAVVCPEGEGFAAEEPLRLPRGFHCYRPPADAPDVVPPPCRRNGFVTFGAFHGVAKINPAVVSAWAEVLRGVPGSRLRLKATQFGDAVVRDRYRAMFAVAGIAADRLDLRPRTATTAEHLAEYNAVDVALDAFPYNGTTTTCEALWMGVPVVTLFGDRPAARMSASLLTQLDLKDLIAGDLDGYVRTACELAERPDLPRLRAGLRGRFARSTLGDAASFTRDLEQALRGAWARWCAGAP